MFSLAAVVVFLVAFWGESLPASAEAAISLSSR